MQASTGCSGICARAASADVDEDKAPRRQRRQPLKHHSPRERNRRHSQRAAWTRRDARTDRCRGARTEAVGGGGGGGGRGRGGLPGPPSHRRSYLVKLMVWGQGEIGRKTVLVEADTTFLQ
jgi:hypothetical protein